jgi:TonB family protein
LLHTLVLSVLPLLQEAQRARPARPSLSARIAKPVPVEPVAPSIIEAPAQVAPRPPAAKAASARAAPEKAVPPPSAPAPMASVEPARPAAEPVRVVPATPVVPPAAPAPAAPQVAAASGPDPGSIARYRLELMDLARRYKKYPRIAQENNWQGRVELRVEFGADGALSSLSVKKGAGRAVLDDEAQAMIRTASAKAAIPPALRGKAFALEIPVDFLLKDEEKN